MNGQVKKENDGYYGGEKIKRILLSVRDCVCCHLSDKLITVSDENRREKIKLFRLKEEKVVTVRNGIDPDCYKVDNGRVDDLRKKFGIKESDSIVGMVGRLVRLKGFDYLIEAAREIINKKPTTRFLIVGEGPYKSEIKRKINAAGLNENFLLVGFHKEIPNILPLIDVFVLPSEEEGHPIVLLEAMVMKKPIVATALPPIKEVFQDGIDGLLVPPKDSRSLAFSILRLLDDAGLAKKLGMQARNSIMERFHWENMINQVENIYENQLKEFES